MSLEEIDGLLWEVIESYYKCYYNEKMNEEMLKLGIAGIEYTKPDKCKTSTYKDYINERKNESSQISLRDELLKKLNIKDIIEAPTPLIHNTSKKRKRKTLAKNK